MPSPVGHILGGTFVYLIGTRRTMRSNLVMGATLLGSVVPDFDFLPGILIGEPGTFHHGISHSVGFAVLFGTVVFFLLRYFRPGDDVARAAIMTTFAYSFHAILDAVSVNEGAKSVPLLWPLSQEAFGINLGLFGHFYHDGFAGGPWSVVRRENVPAVARELIVLGIPSLLIHFWTIKSANTRSPRKIAVEAANE